MKTSTQLISLGMSCQTAHQTQRLANEQPKQYSVCSSPFDWLICPPTNLARWLNDDLPSFKPNELRIHRDHVYWERYNLWFWHSFYKKQGKEKILDLTATMDKELEKFTYQKEKFLRTNLDQTLFVFSNTQANLNEDVYTQSQSELYHLTTQKVTTLQKALDLFFKHPCKTLFLTTEERSEEDVRSLSNIKTIHPDQTEWKGSDEDWSLSFATNAHEKTQ